MMFKSLEIGAVNSESLLTCLTHCGITVEIKHNFLHNEYSHPCTNNDHDDNIFTINNDNNTASNDSTELNNYNNNKFQTNENNTNLFSPDFTSQPNLLWKNNRGNLLSKESPTGTKNCQLFEKYIELLNLTKSSNSLKCIPKFISEYRRAKEHFTDIFIPRLVCYFLFFLFFCSFLSDILIC